MNDNHLIIMKPLLIFGLIIGVTPFSIEKNAVNNLSFKWFCLQTFYSFAVIILNGFCTVRIFISYSSFISSCECGINDAVIHLYQPSLCLSCVLTNIQCFLVARHLPPMLDKWNNVIKLAKIVTGGKVKVHIKTAHVLVTMIILCLTAILEFIFNLIDEVSPQNTVDLVLQSYAMLVNTYHDILIITIALMVRANFKAIADYVKYRKSYGGYSGDFMKWRLLRECHLELSKLTTELDNILTHMIMQSYAFNVFFICINVSYLLRGNIQTQFHLAHILFLILHLSTKTCILSIALSEVPQQVRAPMEYLLDCPSGSYGIEVHRFAFHLSYMQIGFTGSHFFLIDKRIFMAVLSLIITYDLVLLKLS